MQAMTRSWRVGAAFVMAVTLTMGPLAAQSPRELFERARLMEDTGGQLRQAATAYKQVADQAGADRALAAQALLRLADVLLKLADAEAQPTLERIVRDYSDQTAAVAAARSRQLAAGRSAPGTGALGPVCVNCTGDGRVSISPDGRWMSFVDFDKGDAMIRDLTTGQVTRLMADRGVARDVAAEVAEDPHAKIPRAVIFSHDGRQIAFATGDDGPQRLRVAANHPGSRSRVLVDSTAFDYVVPMAWSPDGARLLVQLAPPDGTWQTAWVSVADGALQVIESLDWRRRGREDQPQLSPDGRYIAYAALASNPRAAGAAGPFAPKHIYIVAADGSSKTRVTTTAAVYEHATWTPDGSRLLYTSSRSRGPGPFDLWSVPITNGRPAGSPVVVKSDIGRVSLIGITADGSLHYTVPRSPVPQVSVAAIPGVGAAAAALRPLATFVGQSPALSPDGRLVATLGGSAGPIMRTSGGFSDVRLSSLQGGQQVVHQLPAGTLARPIAPLWLHDGSSVLIQVLEGESPVRVMASVEVASGRYRRLGPLPPLNFTVLSSDGRTLYFNTPIPHTIGAIDLASWQTRTLMADVESGRGFGKAPDARLLAIIRATPELATLLGWAISPDRRALAYVKFEGDDDSDSGRGVLAMVQLDGSGTRDLHTGGITAHPLIWTAAHGIQFVAFELNKGWKVGRIRPGETLPAFTGILMRPTGLDFSPDGSMMAYGVQPPPEIELWTLNLTAATK